MHNILLRKREKQEKETLSTFLEDEHTLTTKIPSNHILEWVLFTEI